MCIAILNKKQQLSKSIMENCWDNNPDGAGLIYTINGVLRTHKELVSFSDFYNTYKKVRGSTKDPIVIHFRIATGSEVNEINCHPFEVNKNLAFCHNGICDTIRSTKTHSDTYQLNDILKSLPNNFIYNSGTMRLIQHVIGRSSKLVFLDNNGKYHIVNEDAGHWDKNGNWFSNYSYESYQKYFFKPKAKKVHTDVNHICDYCQGNGANYSRRYETYICRECNDYFEDRLFPELYL